jgi:hypothetical protein
VIVGQGKRLFSDDGEKVSLALTGSETFSTGVVHLTYRPAIDEPASSSRR